MFQDSLVKYDTALTRSQCKSYKSVSGRNGCMTDNDCLDNARNLCDNDPACFGVSWYQRNNRQELKLCLSAETRSRYGWRTLMKSTGINQKIF